jgi:recombination protein RecA
MSFDSLVTALQKEFSAVNVMRLDEVPKLDVISTGIPSLDYATGIGGYPRRLVTEIYGPEHLGKSVLAMKAMASAQQMGLIPVLISTEGIPDKEWAAVHGVDLNKAIVLFAFNVEDLVEQAKTVSLSEEVGLMVIDSLAAVGTAKEVAEDGKKQAYGISGQVAQMMHALLPNCWQTNKACLIMNQVRDKMVGQYITLNSPGGHSLHHGASMRIRLKPGVSKPNVKSAKVDGKDKSIAKEVTGIVIKNKASEPDREANWWIYHTRPDDLTGFPGRGVDICTSCIDVGVVIEVIERDGAKYSIPDLGYAQEHANRGKANLEDWLREDYTRVDQLYTLVKAKLEE